MSDAKLREIEREFKLNISDETAAAWARARRRYEGLDDVRAFKIIRFAKSGETWTLVMSDLESSTKTCAACNGEGRLDSTYNNRTWECHSCFGTGSRAERVIHLQMGEVNKIFDSMRGRYIVGRWRLTKIEKRLRWMGE